MVSQRQREARKRFRLEHPELVPIHEPTPPKDPSKRKKKKPNFKRKKSDGSKPKPKSLDDNPQKSRFRKHPLRIPGLKPGDCCFICKDMNHLAKNCPKKDEWEKNKICLLCRYRGHSLKNCPNKGGEVVEEKLCYNCGDTGHSLSKCPRPLKDGGTKFALCFICKERGHLSKNCPKSTHGIYPKGGCCKICSEVTHLAKDCPSKGSSRGSTTFYGAELDAPRSNVTRLYSGDDLEDDFMLDDNDSKIENGAIKMEANHVEKKVKKKEGPKVVTFVG